MLHQENGGSSVLGEQRRGAKSKHERRKGSGSADQKDSQGSKSFLERRSPVPASRRNETTKANDADAAVEAARQLSDTNFQLLLNELVACDKKPSEKSPLAKKLLDEVNRSDNNDNRINNNSSCTANNNSVNGTSDLLLNCDGIKELSLNNNINNTGNNTSSSSSSSTHNTSEGQSSERSGGAGCDDFMRGMGSVTGRTMGASESRSDHRSPDDDDTSFSQPAPVIFAGRVEEIRNSMNSSSKRKKKESGVTKSYTADAVEGHIGHKNVDELMQMFPQESRAEEPQTNHKERERGKGHAKVKNNVKTKDNAPTSSLYSPSSDGESTPSPPVTSPERSQRPLSPQSERGGSPRGLAERCEVAWLSDPDRAEPQDWEKVTRRTRRQRKNPPAPLVAPEKREHKERHPQFHHNSNHHHHQQLQQQQQQQRQASQQLQQPLLSQSSPRDTAAIPATPPAALSNSVAPTAAAMTSKKASPPISRIASNTDDEFPPIGPPPSYGAKPFVADSKPKTVTTGPWGSGRMADVLQGKKVPPPPQQQTQQQQKPKQQQQQQPPSPPQQQQQQQSPPPSQQSQYQQQSPPPSQQSQYQQQSPPARYLMTSPMLNQQAPLEKSKRSTAPVGNASRSEPEGIEYAIVVGETADPSGPILPPVAGGDFGDDLREEEGLSFGNFDVETMRSIKASARIRVASRRDEEELKSCFNYRQCVKLLNDHWLEVHKTVQDPPLHPTRPIVAGGIRKQ